MRQTTATDIIEYIATRHGKQDLLRQVARLAQVELHIRELQPWVRDHVVHALLSFLLGVFIHERLLKPAGHLVDPFQWKLAGLFHDVGYPAQIAKDILRPFTDEINNIKRDLNVHRPDVFFRLVPVGLDELTHGVDGICLIQEQLARWGLGVNAEEEYRGMLASGSICHGMISSLSVLCVVDMMYERCNPTREHIDIYEPPGVNWNQSYFENHVVPACAAVFVHNLPGRCFRAASLDPSRSTLPFLLRLSDILQDWDRPSADNPRGYPEDGYNIEAASGRLVFRVADAGRRRKIRADLASSLVATSIEVVGMA